MELDYDGCFGSFPLQSDSHYWEIKILNFYDLSDIMIGVSSRNQVQGRSPAFDKFWGWHCTCARKIRPVPGTSRPDCSDYGSHCKINDTVGVMLSFSGSLAQLTFYVNGSS